jgi:CheY-like chemotaxis protein/anti-sigma regulatory factor (Ser/Thr protein kinase)
MSHELRTPLNAVLGFGQLLELDELTPSQQESVEQIIKGGRHLLELINEVLDISRIETGTLPLSPEPVLVSDLVHDTLALMRPLADHRHIHIVGDQDGMANTHVLADRQRLKQVMLNLVANAIKYNREGGTVAVSCEAVAPDQLRIHVSDTGPGIRPELLENLFVPFERLGAERTDIEGAGVGLALSRRLTEAMGGTLDVASTYGEGSRFSVQLTVVEGPLEQFERVNGTAPESAGVGVAGSDLRHKILYIEDNLANVRLVERVFQRRDDVDVIAAMQGRLGVALAREHRPALILLDLHMPDINGDEVLRQLREDPATATTPVVIVSADATAGQIERLLAEGATGYLTKPLDLHELLAVFNAAVDSTEASLA